MKNINLSSVLEEINNHTWWLEEAPGVYAFVGWPLRAFIEQAKYFHPKYLTLSVFIYRNDFFSELTPADEKLKVYYYIYDQVLKNKNYLKNLRKASEKFVSHFLAAGKILEKNISNVNNKQLWKFYQNFYGEKAYMDFIRYGMALECTDIFSSEKLIGLIKKETSGLSENKALDIAITFSAPVKLSFLEKEEYLIFKGAILAYKILSDKNKIESEKIILKLPTLRIILKKLVKSYFWIGNNFQKAQILDEQYFLDRMKILALEKTKNELLAIFNNFSTKVSRLKQAKKKYLKQYNFSKNLKRHFLIVAYMAEWIDDRKKFMTIADHYNEIFCQQVAKRFKQDVGLVKYYTSEEFHDLLINNKKVLTALLESRRKFSAQVVIRSKNWRCEEKIFYGGQAKSIYNLFSKILNGTEIKGQVACAPVEKISGKAQVILDVNRQNFKAGNILVTTMTRPEFLPLLRRVKAIVTDEGGLTCHAAIVSRELGVPCIIGTKTATRILKNNDLIEMDMNNGTVKKIK
ncbi:MAG: PEP-utilizing enzyme [Patescibacteria group bacterium]|jgi:phosphohistidine swiveling domain-containing protein